MPQTRTYLTEKELAAYPVAELTAAMQDLDNRLKNKRSELNQDARCRFFFDHKIHPSSYSHLLNQTRKTSQTSLAVKVYRMGVQLNGKFFAQADGSLQFDEAPREKDNATFAWYGKEDANIRYYTYYYVTSIRVFTVHKAIVALNFDLNEANLAFYWRRGRDEQNRPVAIPLQEADANPVAAYRGQIKQIKERIRLHFTERHEPSGKRGEERDSMMWLNANQNEMVKTAKKVIAAYVSYDPACGIGVLIPGTLAEVRAELQEVSIPPAVEHYLIDHKTTLKESSNTSLDLARHDDLIDQLKKYNGVYTGYVMTTVKGRNYVDTIRIEIAGGFRIRLASKQNTVELTGFITEFSQGIIHAALRFNPVTKNYATRLTLRVDTGTHELPDGTLSGTYLDTRPHDPIPKVGRLIMVPADPAVTYQDILPTRIDLKQTKAATTFFSDKAYLLKFFAGDFDKFVDSPKVIADDGFRGLYQTLVTDGAGSTNVIADYAGLYLSYCLSSDGFVYCLPLRIDTNGQTTRLFYTGPQETRIRCFLGQATVYRHAVLCLSYTTSASWTKNQPARDRSIASRHTHLRLDADLRMLSHLVYESTTLDIDRMNQPRALREFIHEIPGDSTADLQSLAQVYNYERMPQDPLAREIVTKLLSPQR